MLGIPSIFLFIFFLHVFCNSTKTSANSSDFDLRIIWNLLPRVVCIERGGVLIETNETSSLLLAPLLLAKAQHLDGYPPWISRITNQMKTNNIIPMKICLSIISRTFWIVWMEPEANFSWIHGSSNWAENMSEAPFGRERLKMNVLAEPPITLTIGRYINIQHQKSSFSNYLNYKLTPHISIFTEWLVQLTKEPCQPFVFYFCQQELAGGNEYGLGEFSGGLIFLSQLWC